MTNISNFYYDLELDNILQCPVCFELPKEVIYLCKTGHHVCEHCRKKLTLCPTCQSPLTNCRNFLAETLVSKFSVFKIDSVPKNDEGDSKPSEPIVKPITENNNALKTLKLCRGKYQCLLETCRNRPSFPASELVPHVEKVHGHLFDKFKCQNATFTHNFENFCFLKSKRNFQRAFHISNMGLVFMNLKVVSNGYINCWLSMPAPRKRCNQFLYEIKFSNEKGDTASFQAKMSTNLDGPQMQLENGNVFIISPDVHKVEENHFFSIMVKIVYQCAK